MDSVLIIGFGKLGSHLFYALRKSGLFKNIYAKKNYDEEINPVHADKCNVIFICTEDEGITSAADELIESKVSLKNKFIYHTSGALQASLLLPLKRKGAAIASFHPVQTFEKPVNRYVNRFNNIFIALEGDVKAITKAESIAEAIGSIPFRISSKDKILHHICCVESSNYLVSHFKLINDISVKISGSGHNKKILKNGFNNRSFFDIYKPLIQQTLENVQSRGIKESLTGPIERNDTRTIKIHLDTIKEQVPGILNQYIIMGIETVKLAWEKGSINGWEADNMKELLKSYKK